MSNTKFVMPDLMEALRLHKEAMIKKRAAANAKKNKTAKTLNLVGGQGRGAGFHLFS